MKRWFLIFVSISIGFAQAGKYEIQRNFPSRYVEKRTIVIYLPSSYENDTNRYPVLYMHDGQNLFETSKTGLKGMGSPIKWNVDTALEQLLTSKAIKPCIIVGIFNTAKRIEEYSPPTNTNTLGLLDNYAHFIIEELKPWIDTHYRTDPSPQATGIMGSSMGGLASFYIQMHYPHIFGFAGVISPSFWWGNEQVLRHIDQSTNLSQIQTMYIDAGWRESDEMILPARHVYNKLHPFLGKRLWYYEDRNGTHSESSWQSRVWMPLLLFLGREKPSLPVSILTVMEPPIVGIGDTSTITIEATYPNGIKQTFFPSLKAERDVRINGASFTPQKATPITLTLQSEVGSLTTNILVLPKSRDDITIRFIAQKPCQLLIYRMVENSTTSETNIIIDLKLQNETNITRKRGTRFHFRLVDPQGQLITNQQGKPYDLSVTFTRDRDYEIGF